MKKLILLYTFTSTLIPVHAAQTNNSCCPSLYPSTTSMLSNVKKEDAALGTAATDAIESPAQKILRIIHSIDPTLYEAIIEGDPTGEQHVKTDNIRFLTITVAVQDGLPLIVVGNAIQKLSNDQLRAIVAHELGHYISEHLVIEEKKLAHTYLFNNTDASQEFKKGKQVSGQLPPKKSFRFAYNRIKEYEADRSEILDFGIDITTAITAAEVIQAEEKKELKYQSKATFTRSHPLWSNRIDHFKALDQDVELRKARHETRRHINWKEYAKEYLRLLKEWENA